MAPSERWFSSPTQVFWTCQGLLTPGTDIAGLRFLPNAKRPADGPKGGAA